MHNSLAPQAAGSETVVGLSVAPKLSQGKWAAWESPEGFGAWGNECCLFSELAPQKKIIKKVFLMAWSTKLGSVVNLFQHCLVLCQHYPNFRLWLKIDNLDVFSQGLQGLRIQFRRCQLESMILETLFVR